jgi:hypothetical protein
MQADADLVSFLHPSLTNLVGLVQELSSDNLSTITPYCTSHCHIVEGSNHRKARFEEWESVTGCTHAVSASVSV